MFAIESMGLGSLYDDVHNNLRKLVKGCMHNKQMVMFCYRSNKQGTDSTATRHSPTGNPRRAGNEVRVKSKMHGSCSLGQTPRATG